MPPALTGADIRGPKTMFGSNVRTGKSERNFALLEFRLSVTLAINVARTERPN